MYSGELLRKKLEGPKEENTLLRMLYSYFTNVCLWLAIVANDSWSLVPPVSILTFLCPCLNALLGLGIEPSHISLFFSLPVTEEYLASDWILSSLFLQAISNNHKWDKRKYWSPHLTLNSWLGNPLPVYPPPLHSPVTCDWLCGRRLGRHN